MADINVTINIDQIVVEIRDDAAIAERLDSIDALLQSIKQTGEETMTDLSVLTAEVAENGDAVDSAITLLGSLAQMLRDAATDPQAIADLAASLDAQGSALAAAVVANTPAAPPV